MPNSTSRESARSRSASSMLPARHSNATAPIAMLGATPRAISSIASAVTRPASPSNPEHGCADRREHHRHQLAQRHVRFRRNEVRDIRGTRAQSGKELARGGQQRKIRLPLRRLRRHIRSGRTGGVHQRVKRPNRYPAARATPRTTSGRSRTYPRHDSSSTSCCCFS